MSADAAPAAAAAAATSLSSDEITCAIRVLQAIADDPSLADDHRLRVVVSLGKRAFGGGGRGGSGKRRHADERRTEKERRKQIRKVLDARRVERCELMARRIAAQQRLEDDLVRVSPPLLNGGGGDSGGGGGGGDEIDPHAAPTTDAPSPSRADAHRTY